MKAILTSEAAILFWSSLVVIYITYSCDFGDWVGQFWVPLHCPAILRLSFSHTVTASREQFRIYDQRFDHQICLANPSFDQRLSILEVHLSLLDISRIQRIHLTANSSCKGGELITIWITADLFAVKFIIKVTVLFVDSSKLKRFTFCFTEICLDSNFWDQVRLHQNHFISLGYLISSESTKCDQPVWKRSQCLHQGLSKVQQSIEGTLSYRGYLVKSAETLIYQLALR